MKIVIFQNVHKYGNDVCSAVEAQKRSTFQNGFSSQATKVCNRKMVGKIRPKHQFGKQNSPKYHIEGGRPTIRGSEHQKASYSYSLHRIDTAMQSHRKVFVFFSKCDHEFQLGLTHSKTFTLFCSNLVNFRMLRNHEKV